MGIKCPKCQTNNPDTQKFCGECATPLQPSKEIPVTETIVTPKEELTRGAILAGRYEIIEELGRGGMGNVYRVEDKKTNEELALKLIKPEIASDKRTLERFSNELKLAHKISHKNVCRMYHLGEEEGIHFITMEYVPGEDLKSMIRMTRQLIVGTTISIAKQVCDGLAEAHRLGVIHRDLKPSNIMIDKAGTVRIMDFGIARSLKTKGITGTGVVIGTPEYMSPEQFEGKEADQHSDIYSLGIILYEILTGRIPFEGDTAFAIGLKHKNEEPENPRKLNSQIPEDLNYLILKCLEKDKEKRYKSAGEVRSELNRIEKSVPSIERKVTKKKPITSKEITLKFSLKKLFIPFVALLGLAIIITASVFFIKKSFPKRHITPIHKRITFTENNYYPAVSPDGKFIAYITEEKIDEQKVMVQDIDTGQILEVLRAKDCRYLRWIPDSAEISFWATMKDSSSGIFSVPQLGGTPRRLGEDMFHAWSPDGSQFASCNSNSKEIRLTNKTTGDSTSLPLKGSFKIDAIDWSPNGKFLLFLAWYESHRFAIWTISTDGSEQHKVNEENHDLISPRWAPRGDAIYYFKAAPPIEVQLWKIPISKDTGKPTKSPSYLIGGLEHIGLHCTITSDGNRLLYTREPLYINLWLAEVEGQGKDKTVKTQQLTKENINLCPSISPDGKLIAFSRGYGEPINIFVMPLKGGSPQQITFLNSYDFFPAWSPDGNEIAFSSDQGGAKKVWKVNARGGNPHQFVESELRDVFTKLAWSPGPNILYPNKEGSNFHIFNPNTKEETLLLKESSFISVLFALYSPDGERVAVLGKRDSVPLGLWVISLQDSSEVLLLKGNFLPIGWSSNRKMIYVSEQMQGAIKILNVNIENGETKIVFVLPITLEKGQPYPSQMTMTPDARHFVFPIMKRQSDVWMIENFDPEMK